MAQVQATRPRADIGRWAFLTIMAVVCIATALTFSWWSPRLKALLSGVQPTEGAHEAPAAKKGTDDHGHDHAGHDEGNSLELSEQAQRAMGLGAPGVVKLSTFTRTVSVPGIVVERPGRSRVEITAPLTGIVTKIFTNAGEAVSPGETLFEMRLTHEELVQLQADLLRTAEELDVIRREVARLTKATEGGAIAGKTLLDREYDQQKQEAVLRAQRQALILHGLNEAQVDEILKTRMLLSTLEVRVPTLDDKSMKLDPSRVLQVQELKAELGKHVTAGDVLAVLADHTDLLIAGEAFERDSASVSQVLAAQRPITAILDSAGSNSQTLEGLKILYLANRVDPESRSQHFYVELTNRVQRDTGANTTPRYVDWVFKPGQRMQLILPIEEWKDRIVLPVEAVAQDGVESYVFRINGDHFDRQPVHVEYRDPRYVVIANDGSLFPGDKFALRGAQQMQLALKNKAGGGIDPHAGHSH